jgi:hypothetical protein
MHTVTVKISAECPPIDNSADGIADLCEGIHSGAITGCVEVVEGPADVVKDRLLAVLLVQPELIVPLLSRKIVVANAGIMPDMSTTQFLQTMDCLADCARIADQSGRDDIAVEIGCIRNALEDCHAG